MKREDKFPDQKEKQKKNKREQNVYYAQLAEQASRYEDVIKFIGYVVRKVMKREKDLTNEEKNLFYLGYKNLICQKRKQWRTVMEKYEELEELDRDDDDHMRRIYLNQLMRERIETEIKVLCDEALIYLPHLVDCARSNEARAFYLKMQADFTRYMADASIKDNYKTKCIQAKDYYDQAIHEAEQLFTTHPLRLALALNYSVFLNDNMKKIPQAIEMAKTAFDMALFDLETVEEERINDTLRVMQLLKDNFIMWGVDLKHEMLIGRMEIDPDEDPLAARLIMELHQQQKNDKNTKVLNNR